SHHYGGFEALLFLRPLVGLEKDRFHPDPLRPIHIAALSLPTNNTSDGSIFIAVNAAFSDGRTVPAMRMRSVRGEGYKVQACDHICASDTFSLEGTPTRPRRYRPYPP